MDTSLQTMEIYLQKKEDGPKKVVETQMTSSTISTVSSLTSPTDSGVQLLDSESDLTSGCETDSHTKLSSGKNTNIWSELQEPLVQKSNNIASHQASDVAIDRQKIGREFTESDFVNKNVVVDNNKLLSRSLPNYFDKFRHEGSPKHNTSNLIDDVFEMEHPIKSNTEVDLMNLSLNSYELLDYTLQNTTLNPPQEAEVVDMHVSMSEEVNENLKVILDGKEAPASLVTEPIPVVEDPETKPTEDQIVFRRQRKKKSKSDTPKKRVSFHEDILNSTKIDDIHINLGFITHEPDVSLSFFQRGFVRKPDVVKGRYSWAAEGDAPFYEKHDTKREIKSDIYIHHPRGSSSSSSSTGSISSSIDEEDSSGSDENVFKKEPTQKQPKSSCLKKTKHKKYIDTNIVQEEMDLKKKKSETNLLDSNIFGSLKNILKFSSSLPLAERGIPEGQEDCIYSSSQDLSGRRKSFGNFHSLQNTETVEVAEIKAEPASKIHSAKTNLKLTKSEGFYPNYPSQDIPANIILCDSNVYEHKGISYSYEYDNFQKTFEQENKPKNSQMYRKILKEFNFFRRKAKQETQPDGEEEFEIVNSEPTSVKPEVNIEEVEEIGATDYEPPHKTSTPLSYSGKYAKQDWSDNETVVSEISESHTSSRHLYSPKRKVQRSNHYTVQSPFKTSSENNLDVYDTSKSLPSLRASSSKSSLINRFLRNVTIKKMLDHKSQGKMKRARNYIGFCPKSVKALGECNLDIDKAIEREVMSGVSKKQPVEEPLSKIIVTYLKKHVFKSQLEELLRVFPVRSAYNKKGDSKPLQCLLTDQSLYIISSARSVFTTHFVLTYDDLNAILIGPSAQTIHFSNRNLTVQCVITTGCSRVTNELIGQLEMAMRKAESKPPLPAIKVLEMRDMVNLRGAICKQTAVDKDEEYYYYSIVNIQDFVPKEEAFAAMGPTKEGPLMFKTSDGESGRWETAYFILKAGVLYMLSSVSQRVPMRVFPLINGACQGARRVFSHHRPHTFQLIVDGDAIYLAAPNEYVASEWLQELIHAASGVYNCHKEKYVTQSCSLLMTSDHILTVREVFPCLTPQVERQERTGGPQALSCAAIVDLVSFRLPSAEQSWCILEFSCREVHEYSGDWIVYFSTNAELETFIATLEMLWQYLSRSGDSFPLSTIPETDPLSRKCVDIYKSLIESWPPNTVHLQFV